MNRIQENPDFIKDPVSGAVVNVNKTAHMLAIEAAKQRKQQKEDINTMMRLIIELKQEVAELKER